MDNFEKSVGIDWRWVEKHLSAKERLEGIEKASTKEAVMTHLQEALDIAKSKSAPRMSVAKRAIIRFDGSSIGLEGGITLSGKELSSHIKGAGAIYAFLVTIGKDVEEAATSLMDSGDHLLGYLLDRAGSFAVESLAENMESFLRGSLAPEGFGVSMRFSPGYCDWPIEEQFKLAKIIDFAKAGVVLNENCVMIPKKSISAIVGTGPKELFAKILSPCAVCNMKVCDYRRKA